MTIVNRQFVFAAVANNLPSTRVYFSAVTDVPLPPVDESADRTVARASGIMSFSLGLSRVLGMLRDTAMTAMFAVSIQTDAYGIAITIPDLLFMLVAGGGLSSAFMPVFSQLLHTKKEREAWKLFSVVVTVCSLAVAVLIAVAWALAPWVAHFIAKDKTDKAGHNISALLEPHIVEMGRILLPAQFAFLIGSILLATLYARRQFLAPSLAPNVYNVGIIVGAIVGGLSPLGIAGMPWGGLTGAMIGNLLLPAYFMAKTGSHFKPSLDLKAEGVGKFFRLLAPVIFGFSLPSVVQLITTYFAAHYSEGINTVFRLSNNLMQAPSGIFGQSMALAAFPVLAQFYAQKRMDLYASQMTRSLRTVIYLGVPSAALMLALAPQISHLIYGYGKAAKDGHLEDIALTLRIYAPSIIAWCIQPVLMRGFFSVHKTMLPVALSTGMTAIFIAMCTFCTSQGLPFTSLAWSTDIAALLLVVILFVALEKSVAQIDRKGVFKTFGKALVAATAMGAVAFVAAYATESVGLGRHRLVEFLCFLLTATCAAWAYYFLTKRLKMPEVEYFDRALAKLNRKR
ncbi:murein biosynthesis integral membrane protein MurJ [Fimbriimonas ginsengisoli]|uniref:Virulence factor mviN protein n=1 Tax=Fimbriimonas ginsengisoli Gsoil 348 TaxID=661478 RepID=A0A068NTV5_FIMGI|nr:murein biosynthesis integral membrane protein MurJ [Fimbriimonas ginsengisoli]AIE86871.1 Virulence factor mviN protein [Fimbriimonas ginsengisoli Gsoil 348]